MRLIPAVSIKNGKVAIVENGQYRYIEDPIATIQQLESPEVFILDINGIETNTPDLNLITKMSNYKDVWVDAGPQTVGGAMDILISGVARVVIGSKSIRKLEFLEEAVDLSDNVIFSLDYDDAIIIADRRMKGMDVPGLFDKLEEMAVSRVMLFDLGGIRDGTPPDLNLVKDIIGRFEESYIAGKFDADGLETMKEQAPTGLIVDFRTLEEYDVR